MPARIFMAGSIFPGLQKFSRSRSNLFWFISLNPSEKYLLQTSAGGITMMRKFLGLFLVLAMFFTASLVSAEGQTGIRLLLNQKEVPLSAISRAGSRDLMVPLRAFSESLGASISWNDEDGTITIAKDHRIVVFLPGDSSVVVNAETVIVEPSPVVVKGVALAPLHFFLEFWDFKVYWNEELKRVELESSDFVPFGHISRQEEQGFSNSLRNWIEKSRDTAGIQAWKKEGKLFILGTFGKKPSGGYEVEIKKVFKKQEKLRVEIEFKEPLPDQPAIQVISRPYDLVFVDWDRTEGIKGLVCTVRGLGKESFPVFLELSGDSTYLLETHGDP
jgi:hypothetical protein